MQIGQYLVSNGRLYVCVRAGACSLRAQIHSISLFPLHADGDSGGLHSHSHDHGHLS